MESRNKKEMSVDELVKQLKLVLDIDEPEESPKKEASNELDTTGEVEDAPLKAVGEDDGNIGDGIESLFEEEKDRKSKRKKKKKLFGRKRKEESEDDGDMTERHEPEDLIVPEEHPEPEEPFIEEPEPEKPAEITDDDKKDDVKKAGWLASALTGLFFDKGDEEEQPEEEKTVAEPEAPEENEPAEEPETVCEDIPETEDAAGSEELTEEDDISNAEEIAETIDTAEPEEIPEEEAEEEEAPEADDITEVTLFPEVEEAAEPEDEKPEQEEEPEPEQEEIPDDEDADMIILPDKSKAEGPEPEESEKPAEPEEPGSEAEKEHYGPFVNDVFAKKQDENEEDFHTKAMVMGAVGESDGGEEDGAAGSTQTFDISGELFGEEDSTRPIITDEKGQPVPEEIIDENLLSDIENFDVIFSDKNAEEDGYSTADEAIMDAFAEKPKPKKQKKNTEAEALEDIFNSIPASPVGGRSVAADEDDDEEVYADEFTSYDQRRTFLEEYKKKYGSYKRSLIASAFFAVILFIYELLPLFVSELPHAFNRTDNPAVFTLIGLALFSLCAAFASKLTFSGLRSVFKGSTTLPSMAFLTVLVTYIYGIITAIRGDLILCPMMSVAALSIVMMLAAEMRIVKRRTLAFRIISGSPVKNKYVLERHQGDGEKVPGSVLGIAKAKFIGKFTSSGLKRSNSYGYLNLLFPAAALIFVLFFVGGLLLKKDISYAAAYGFTAGIFCIPAAVYAALSFPSYLCSKKAYSDGSCVVSDAEAEKYTAASVVFFEDSDVFPPSHDKITSVRLYNDSRMDHIMYIMMSVFSKLGGPLLVICENAAKEYGSSPDTEIVRSGKNGVEAKVDSHTVLIGSADFMGGILDRAYREDDGMYENSANERIMYMAVNGVITAKFYIEYGMDPEFKKMIKQLSNSTRTVAIRTLDPNIDDELLASFIDPEMYNCRIIAGRTRKNEVKDESCGTVVSKSSVKSLLRTLLLCDKAVYTSKINALICFLSMIIGLLITVFLIITNSLNVINVLYAAAYQLILTIIIKIVTRLHI